MKGKFLLPVFILIVAAATFSGVEKAYAQEPAKTSFIQNLIQRLAQKFGLKETDVQAVFDEASQQRQTQMQTRFEDRLSQAVTDGQLTEDQKQLILAKNKELQAKREQAKQNWQNLTAEERKVAMQKERQELEDWAKQNSIDIKYLFGGLGKFGKGMRSHW